MPPTKRCRSCGRAPVRVMLRPHRTNPNQRRLSMHIRRTFTITGIAAAALLLSACQSAMKAPAAATPAPAAAPAAAAPPPAWQQGRTAEQASSKLAPLAGKLVATPAADIPLASFKLPPGFKAEVWATGMPGVRAMARGARRQDLRRHARHRPRVRGHRRRRAAHEPRGGGQADAAGRRGGGAQRRAVRDGDRQGAALRRHRGEPDAWRRWT